MNVVDGPYCPYSLTGMLNDREDDHVTDKENEEIGPTPPLFGSIRDYEWAKVLRKMSIRLLKYVQLEKIKVSE